LVSILVLGNKNQNRIIGSDFI